MAKNNFDGVVVGVRYAEDGQVDWVRVFERRGPIFSDRIHINRAALIEQLQSGKNFMAGERVLLEAGTFKVSDAVKLIEKNGKSVLVTGDHSADHDSLASVPIV